MEQIVLLVPDRNFLQINNGRKAVELMRLIKITKQRNKLFPKQITINVLNLAHAFHNILGSGSSQERFAP